MEWGGIEKRRFPRVRLPCKIIIYLPKEHTLVTYTENIGCGGVRVVVRKNLKPLSIVGLEIFIRSQNHIKCKGKVVWQIKVKDHLTKEANAFDIGLEFMDIKKADKEEIMILVGSLLEEI